MTAENPENPQIPDDAGKTFQESMLERMQKMEEALKSHKEGLDDHDKRLYKFEVAIQGFTLWELNASIIGLQSNTKTLQRQVIANRLLTIHLDKWNLLTTFSLGVDPKYVAISSLVNQGFRILESLFSWFIGAFRSEDAPEEVFNNWYQGILESLNPILAELGLPEVLRGLGFELPASQDDAE